MNSAFITIYERDNETELDFAEARMYSNQLGRFTTTDPLFIEDKRLLDPQQLNLYAYTKNNPLIFTDPTGMTFNTVGLNDEQKEKWKQIGEVANAKDAKGNYINAKLHEEYEKLDKDSRVYNIINTTEPSKGGEFTITKFKGDNDFSEANISLNFNVLKKMDKAQDAEMLIPDFKKAEGLFGKNGEVLRLAEFFGHEAAHAVYAMENTSDAVKDQKYKLERENWENAHIDKKHRRYDAPRPPDFEQKANFRTKFHNSTEIYAQQQEKLINGELRNYQKILSQK